MKKFIVPALILLILLAVYWLAKPAGDEQVSKQAIINTQAPLVYPVKDWQLTDRQSDDFREVMSIMGQAVATEDTLDFYGRKASLYRFSPAHQSTAYAILSPKDQALELVWYYPDKSDDDATKHQAIILAKKAYQALGVAAGQQGGDLVARILQGQQVNHQKLGRLTVATASCQAYRCQVVILK